MRIAIDALGIQNYGGGRTATLTLLDGLFKVDSQNQYTVFVCQPEQSISTYKNVRQIISPFKNRFLMRVWAQVIFLFQKNKYDLIHYIKNLGVIGLNIPSIVTIYDMTTLIHPELFPKVDVLYWKTIEKYTLQNAARIIAISKTTAQDIERIYGISAAKISVIYPSIAPQFKPASQNEISRIREKYQLPERYILHVGRIDRKKNLSLLVKAFALAKFTSPGFVDHLVIVGEVYEKSKDDTLLPMIAEQGLSQDVIFTGRVPDNDLPAIISGANFAISASVHEGFGLAALESLACGTPLIAYRAGALQEVVGDAALILENLDEQSLAQAIIKISNAPELRLELSLKGKARAQQYDWEHTALQTLKLYEEIVNENR